MRRPPRNSNSESSAGEKARKKTLSLQHCNFRWDIKWILENLQEGERQQSSRCANFSPQFPGQVKNKKSNQLIINNSNSALRKKTKAASFFSDFSERTSLQLRLRCELLSTEANIISACAAPAILLRRRQKERNDAKEPREKQQPSQDIWPLNQGQ